MAELQRSSQTFRRSGSSGLVWNQNQRGHGTTGDTWDCSLEIKELRHSHSVGSVKMLKQHRGGDGKEHSRSNDGNQTFRTQHVPPAVDPPSPKVSRCIFCRIFRKEEPSHTSKPKPRRY
ncbi:unnamed protein product [Urochloa decumbens]|uniref:Uncharacterized protein n=1 Tax=Urochloa decumbens TaxID=240449 RepID=A0ABC9GKB2_9POAL